MWHALQEILHHPHNQQHKVVTLVRLAWWLLNRQFFHLPIVMIFHDGTKILCYPDSSFGSLIVYCHWPEWSEYTYLLDHLRPNDTVIDVGAGFGDYTVLAADVVGRRGRVFAFEPTDREFTRLKENIRLNGFKNAKVFQEIVAEKSGRLSFATTTETELSHITTQGGGSRPIKAVSLDDFAKKQHLNQISYVKIDVEGAEKLVLAGMQGLLKRQAVQRIQVELNIHQSEFPSSVVTSVLPFLRRHNFKCYRFLPDGSRTPIQNWDGRQTFNIIAELRHRRPRKGADRLK